MSDGGCFRLVDLFGPRSPSEHLFKNPHPSFNERVLRLAFRLGDWAMRKGLAPGARLRVVARRRA